MLISLCDGSAVSFFAVLRPGFSANGVEAMDSADWADPMVYLAA